MRVPFRCLLVSFVRGQPRPLGTLEHHLSVGRSFARDAARRHALRAPRITSAARASHHEPLQKVDAANDEPNHAHILHDDEQDDEPEPLAVVFDVLAVGHEKGQAHRGEVGRRRATHFGPDHFPGLVVGAVEEEGAEKGDNIAEREEQHERGWVALCQLDQPRPGPLAYTRESATLNFLFDVIRNALQKRCRE